MVMALQLAGRQGESFVLCLTTTETKMRMVTTPAFDGTTTHFGVMSLSLLVLRCSSSCFRQ